MFKNFAVISLCALSLLLLLSGEAVAYIDPGAGSMILQALLAGAVAALVFSKRIYFYFKGLFHRDESESKDNA